MQPERQFEPFRNVVVPVIAGVDPGVALATARLIAEPAHILLAGFVLVDGDDSLSKGTTRAQALRRHLRTYPEASLFNPRVSHDAWSELRAVVENREADLLILEWPNTIEALGKELDEVLDHPPCDIALVRQPITIKPKKILVSIRGGPYSELALRIALAATGQSQARLVSLHLRNPQTRLTPTQKRNLRKQEAAFQGIAAVLDGLPEIEQRQLNTSDTSEAILQQARSFDLVVMGASASHAKQAAPLGTTAGKVLQNSNSGVVIVKTRRPMPADLQSEAAGQRAISVLVDKWFAENTYNADEFADLERLRVRKESQGMKISLALPALNEERTVGKVIRTLKGALMDKSGLVDELVLIDSGSTDRTRKIAMDLGIPVYVHQDILPQYKTRSGKGEALWKSLYVTKGDLLFWVDTDIDNINPRFVYGLIGPLLADDGLQFVKGFYRRPLRVGNRIQAAGGGRVTELTARPMLNLFYPELSGILQPLSGEYGGRRSALEKLGFFSGYGVEIGLLIDIFERYGLAAIGQTDLQERIHHNQSLEALSLMSFAIIQVMVSKLEKRYGREILKDVNKTMKLIRYVDERFFLDVEDLTELERPPMIDLPEYKRRKRAGRLTAGG